MKLPHLARLILAYECTFVVLSVLPRLVSAPHAMLCYSIHPWLEGRKASMIWVLKRGVCFFQGWEQWKRKGGGVYEFDLLGKIDSVMAFLGSVGIHSSSINYICTSKINTCEIILF